MASELEKALAWLNKKLDQELGEFPDLCFEAASRYGVKYEDLADAYDEQYAAGNLVEKWDAIPDAEKAELTKAFSQGFAEQVAA